MVIFHWYECTGLLMMHGVVLDDHLLVLVTKKVCLT